MFYFLISYFFHLASLLFFYQLHFTNFIVHSWSCLYIFHKPYIKLLETMIDLLEPFWRLIRLSETTMCLIAETIRDWHFYFSGSFWFNWLQTLIFWVNMPQASDELVIFGIHTVKSFYFKVSLRWDMSTSLRSQMKYLGLRWVSYDFWSVSAMSCFIK